LATIRNPTAWHTQNPAHPPNFRRNFNNSAADFVHYRKLGGGKACYWNAKRRTGNVIESRLAAKSD
jgi:hypothetical protein